MANVVFIFGRLGNSQICSRLYRQWHFLIITVVSTDMRTNKHTYTHIKSAKSSQNWHCNAYMIYSVTLSSRVCLSIKFCFCRFLSILVFFFVGSTWIEFRRHFFLLFFFKWVLRGLSEKHFFLITEYKKKELRESGHHYVLFGFQFFHFWGV